MRFIKTKKKVCSKRTVSLGRKIARGIRVHILNCRARIGFEMRLMLWRACACRVKGKTHGYAQRIEWVLSYFRGNDKAYALKVKRMQMIQMGDISIPLHSKLTNARQSIVGIVGMNTI